MRIEYASKPSYTLAYCFLQKGESLFVERDGMAVMSAGIEISAGVGGQGVSKAFLRKSFGGENFFMGRYTSMQDNAWVAVAPKFPGDVTDIDLQPTEPMLIESGALLAYGDSVTADIKYSGVKTLVLREGVTMIRVYGTGTALVSSYGGLMSYTLGAGERVLVDTGHIVGFSESVTLKVGPLGGVATSMVTGEGLVGQLTGPGRVLAQTRAESTLKNWLFPGRSQN